MCNLVSLLIIQDCLQPCKSVSILTRLPLPTHASLLTIPRQFNLHLHKVNVAFPAFSRLPQFGSFRIHLSPQQTCKSFRRLLNWNDMWPKQVAVVLGKVPLNSSLRSIHQNYVQPNETARTTLIQGVIDTSHTRQWTENNTMQWQRWSLNHHNQKRILWRAFISKSVTVQYVITNLFLKLPKWGHLYLCSISNKITGFSVKISLKEPGSASHTRMAS